MKPRCSGGARPRSNASGSATPQRERKRSIDERKRQEAEDARKWWDEHGRELAAIDEDIEDVRRQMRQLDTMIRAMRSDHAEQLDRIEQDYRREYQAARDKRDGMAEVAAKNREVQRKRDENRRFDRDSNRCAR